VEGSCEHGNETWGSIKFWKAAQMAASQEGLSSMSELVTSSRPALVTTQLPIKWVLWVLSLGVKRPGCEADHSRPAIAEVKKIWINASTSPFLFYITALLLQYTYI
jgi:hypothetical protein